MYSHCLCVCVDVSVSLPELITLYLHVYKCSVMCCSCVLVLVYTSLNTHTHTHTHTHMSTHTHTHAHTHTYSHMHTHTHTHTHTHSNCTTELSTYKQTRFKNCLVWCPALCYYGIQGCFNSHASLKELPILYNEYIYSREYYHISTISRRERDILSRPVKQGHTMQHE